MKPIVWHLLFMLGFASANGNGNKASLADVPDRCSLNDNMATENVTLIAGPIVSLVESPIEMLVNYYSQVKYNWQSRRNLENLPAAAAAAECQCDDVLMPIDVCYVNGDGLATCNISSLQLFGAYHMFCYLYVAALGVVFYYLWVMWVAKPRRRQPVKPDSEDSPLTESPGDDSRFIINYHDPVSHVEEIVDKHCLKPPMDPNRIDAGQRRVPHYTFYPTYVVYEQYADQPNQVDYDDFVLDDNYPLYIITYL